jgi:Spy/CpxP family protein refolding chaperone
VHSVGRVRGRLVAAVAVGATTALLAAVLAACSPGADYPAVLAPPTARTGGQPMSQEQVQQETNALVNDRTQLSADAQAAQASARASGMMAPPATTGTTPSAGATTRQ